VLPKVAWRSVTEVVNHIMLPIILIVVGSWWFYFWMLDVSWQTDTGNSSPETRQEGS
jgi:hypothetical protein